MSELLGTLPYWELRFDEQGDPDGAARDALVAEVAAQGVTDLFFFAHGWNNSPEVARSLFRGFYELLASAAAGRARPASRIGLVGVIWPSMRWADEEIPDFGPVAAAGLSGGGSADEESFAALREFFPAPEQRAALDRLQELLRTQPEDPASLAEFQQLMGSLGLPANVSSEDAGELSLVEDPPEVAFGKFVPVLQAGTSAGGDGGPAARFDSGEAARFADSGAAGVDEGGAGRLNDSGAGRFDDGGAGRFDDGGAAGIAGAPAAAFSTGEERPAALFGQVGSLIWKGAKLALQQFTYLEMKKRAGTVGEHGLGPLVGALQQAVPQLRVHLIGHSFGARLVSFALAGLPDSGTSPVKSLMLIEGAFSHFAFATSLPHRSGQGALGGKASRVDGPVVVVHSSHDTAVGVLYPIASRGTGDDAADLSEALFRWGAMGADGAQEVGASDLRIGPLGQTYSLAAGAFWNVDASDVVRKGGFPAGAHSDIIHDELAWLALSAAGLASAAG